MADRDKAPLPSFVKQSGRLAPMTPYDLELFEQWPEGAQVDGKLVSRRSPPHHKLYWQMLIKAVEATGIWPSKEALHTAIKVELGRFEPIFDLRGRVCGMTPDSTSFKAMTQAEFQVFFEQAVAVLAEALGTDPLAWREAA